MSRMIPDNISPAVLTVLSSVGPVELCTEHLIDPRAFKHIPHPLAEHTELLSGLASTASIPVFDGDVWALRDAVWRFLVSHHLLPRLGHPVSLAHGPYNSAYARFIAGLTENEEALPHLTVSVGADVVAAAFLICSAAPPPNDSSAEAPHTPPRTSTITHGLAGLLGRRVELLCTGQRSEATGRLIAVHQDILVLLDRGVLTVLPSSAIAQITTIQLTADEAYSAEER